jgi:hypothetical protein
MVFYTKKIIVLVVVVLLSGIGLYFFTDIFREKEQLGDFESVQEANETTKKALLLLSSELQEGVEGVEVLQTFHSTQNLIFKDEQNEK